MKEVLRNLAFFALFVVAFSAITSCSGTGNSTTNEESANTAAGEKKKSDYPPIAAAVVVTAVMAPAHMRSIASPGTVIGKPARIAAVRPRVSP